jgi:predicted nucleotidyltransferase
VKKIIEIKYGSHLYGTDTPSSDLDLKSVFLPTREDLLSGNHRKTIQLKRPKLHGEKNTKDDVDVEMLSLDRFIELLSEGQTMALDMVFAPKENFTAEGKVAHASEAGRIWDEIVLNKERMLTKNVTAFVGYARKQAAKYGVKGSRIGAVREVLNLLKTLHPHSKLSSHEELINKLVADTKEFISMEKTALVEVVELPAHKDGPPQKYLHCCGRKTPFTNKVLDAVKIYQRVFDEYGARALQAESNKGVDFKALSHAVRVNTEAVELLTTGKVTLPLPNRELILAIKKGEIPFKEVSVMIENGMAEIEAARAVSSLRHEPDLEWAREFVERIYSEICGSPYKVTLEIKKR